MNDDNHKHRIIGYAGRGRFVNPDDPDDGAGLVCLRERGWLLSKDEPHEFGTNDVVHFPPDKRGSHRRVKESPNE